MRFTFRNLIDRELFPSSIFVTFNTLMENIFLRKCPSTFPSDDVTSIESNLVEFKIDLPTYERSNNNETMINFHLLGVNDFGLTIETIRIYQDEFDLNNLNTIQVRDDIRQWNEEYQPCFPIQNENDQNIITFEKRTDPTKQCHFLPKNQRPLETNGHNGVSTLKKTTKDCFDAYQDDPTNIEPRDDRNIVSILFVPVYYIIMPSSCKFGPPDTATPTQSDEPIPKGTIIDPDQPNRIQLARVHGEVLQSRSMKQYNRYFRRTVYYVDEIDDNNNIIRYLFCGEYPYILSILDQLEECNQISKAQKYDEYLRFCNMLHQLLQFTNLSESIKLIQFNNDQIDDADYQPLWEQIKQDINQWYRTSNDPFSSPLFIDSKIFGTENVRHVILFYTRQTREDQEIMIFIRDLEEKLKNRDYMVDDAESDLDLINSDKQLIFICTGSKNDEINRLIMNAERKKIQRAGIFRDVFVLVNDAIRNFPCRFLQSVPYLTFDLQRRAAQLTPGETGELFRYLNKINFCTQQCTSVGAGCAAAFYFNYAKLISPLIDHQLRVESMREEFLLNVHENHCKFISKWVFVIPWTIENTSQILSHATSIERRDQLMYGYQLSLWKKTDSNLTITVGGIYRRSYSPLFIYKLTKIDEGITYYFPMEIPAALHGLQNQYDNLLSHFHFGSFNPLEQATVFREKVKEFFAKDFDKTWHENILLVPLDKPPVLCELNSDKIIQQTRILLETLWKKLT